MTLCVCSSFYLTTFLMAPYGKLRELFITVFIAINFSLIVYHASMYTLCEEPEVDIFTRLLICLDIITEQNQCPTLGSAVWKFVLDLVKELCVLVVLATLLQLSAWILRKWRDRSSVGGAGKYTYHLCKNAYAQRGEVLVRRISDTDEALFKMDPLTKRFKCVLWHPLDEDEL